MFKYSLGIRWSLPALLVSLVAAGCDDSTGSPTNITGETSLSVYLTDAPGDVDSVWVQIDDIVLAGQGAPVSLLEEPTGLINLTELVDVAVALVEGVPVEPGLYTQVRFVLRGAVLLEADGTVYAYGDVVPPAGLEVTGDLTCPSCSQSGIKVRLPGGVELAEGDDAGILMDFDVSQSFGHQAGQSGRWVMHPTILGMVDDAAAIEGGESEGRITGLVSLDLDVEVPMCGGEARDLGAFVPVATATTLIDDEAAALVFTGETDADGEFEIEVLGADTYDLGYEVETDFGAEKLIWTAEVNPGQAVIATEGGEVNGSGLYCDRGQLRANLLTETHQAKRDVRGHSVGHDV